MATTNTPRKLARLLKSATSSNGWSAGFGALGKYFNSRKWSARNTVGGVLALATAESVVVEGISWQAVALGCAAVLPLGLDALQKKAPSCRCNQGPT